MSFEAKIIEDNSADFLRELANKVPIVLEAWGLAGEGFTKANITASGRVDTGQYRNSITHTVRADESTVYIGSNLEHAIYNELGTGQYATDGNGRRGWWVYVAGQDEQSRAAHRNPESARKVYSFAEAKQIVALLRSKGLDAHMTQGMKPNHALQKAASEHNAEYIAIEKNILEV